jgi:hypothetical protein
MTHLHNFERDLFWTDYSAVVASVTASIDSETINVANSGVVGQRHSFAGCDPVNRTATDVTDGSTFGALILPPNEDDTIPYRVKGYAQPGGAACTWMVGFFEGLGGVRCQRCRVIGSGPILDEVVCMRSVVSSDPNFGDPLCFFAVIHRDVPSYVAGSIQVQRLIAKPDQYASAVR